MSKPVFLTATLVVGFTLLPIEPVLPNSDTPQAVKNERRDRNDPNHPNHNRGGAQQQPQQQGGPNQDPAWDMQNQLAAPRRQRHNQFQQEQQLGGRAREQAQQADQGQPQRQHRDRGHWADWGQPQQGQQAGGQRADWGQAQQGQQAGGQWADWGQAQQGQQARGGLQRQFQQQGQWQPQQLQNAAGANALPEYFNVREHVNAWENRHGAVLERGPNGSRLHRDRATGHTHVIGPDGGRYFFDHRGTMHPLSEASRIESAFRAAEMPNRNPVHTDGPYVGQQHGLDRLPDRPNGRIGLVDHNGQSYTVLKRGEIRNNRTGERYGVNRDGSLSYRGVDAQFSSVANALRELNGRGTSIEQQGGLDVGQQRPLRGEPPRQDIVDPFALSDAGHVINQRGVERIGDAACGPTACAMIHSDRGQPFDITQIARDAGLTLDRGTFAPELANALHNSGVPNARYSNNVSMTDLAAATRGGSPAIVHLKGPGWPHGHFVVVDGIGNVNGTPYVAVRDPWEGRRYSQKASSFRFEMTGDAVLTNPPGF